MKQKKKTILIDSKHQARFSIDSSGKKVFTLDNRTGILKNSIDGTEIESESIEFGSLEQINEYLSSNKKRPLIKNDHKFNSQFTAGRILRENQGLLETLEDLELYKWDLTSKISSFRRYIINRENKLIENEFNHFSISILFKLEEGSPNLEVGVGTTDNLKINRDGLKLRLKDIVNNNREFRDIEFKERVPLVLDSGDGGILFHEIIGHSLEADYIAKKVSPFSIADIGKQIFPESLTVSTFEKKDTFFSGIQSDDEGRTLNNHELIKNGILNRVLTDNFHNDLLNLPNSGSARTEDFTKLLQPRMYSVYIKPGNFNPEELIGSVKYGIFAKEFGEGKVFFSNKTFSLIVKESYLIENGVITYPLGTVILKGEIQEVLDSIKMIGNDFRYDRGVSYCYKNGQTLNVRVGQPTIKIDNIIVSRI